ncbi:hypothetical protein [Desulfosporosinus fructosivorans]
MPKQVFDGKKLTIVLDETEPKDKVELVRRNYLGQNPKGLTPADKIKLFDAYVDAGVITL